MHSSPSAHAGSPYGTAASHGSAPRERSPSEVLDAVVLATDGRRVVIRLLGGEELEVGRVHGREAAIELARQTATAVDEAVLARTWPAVGDRLLRPGAIVSIDVVRA